MPLIIVCGLPCSGKTKRTEEIREILKPELEKRGWSAITTVNDELAGVKYSGMCFFKFFFLLFLFYSLKGFLWKELTLKTLEKTTAISEQRKNREDEFAIK